MQDGVGIIYRFPYESEVSQVSKTAHSEYYELPPMIDTSPVLRGCTSPEIDINNMYDNFYRHCASVYNENEGNAVKWRFPESALELTRVWRQKAVIILPDELRKDLPSKKPGVSGVTMPAFQYIEDISERKALLRKFGYKL